MVLLAEGAHAPEPADPEVAADVAGIAETLVPEALLQPAELAVLEAGLAGAVDSPAPARQAEAARSAEAGA